MNIDFVALEWGGIGVQNNFFEVKNHALISFC
jgi:hypothetical protein